MLLFHKRDLLVTLTLDDGTVTFSKPVKEILKYQHRYNYKFKLYETGKVTVADDYIIEGETLTVFFGSAYVEYSSSGATYNEGGSGGSGGEGYCEDCVKILSVEPVDTSEHSDATIYVYTESDGWFDISEIYPVSTIVNTQDEIPDAYVINEAVMGVTFPVFITPISDFVTGDTHVPDVNVGDGRGYYIEYADAYSILVCTEFNILVLKNGVVNYFEGLG